MNFHNTFVISNFANRPTSDAQFWASHLLNCQLISHSFLLILNSLQTLCYSSLARTTFLTDFAASTFGLRFALNFPKKFMWHTPLPGFKDFSAKSVYGVFFAANWFQSQLMKTKTVVPLLKLLSLNLKMFLIQLQCHWNFPTALCEKRLSIREKCVFKRFNSTNV